MRNIRKLIILLAVFLCGCAADGKSEENIIRISILGSVIEGTIDDPFIQGALLFEKEFNAEARSYSVMIDMVEDYRTYEGGVTAATDLSKNEQLTAVINLQDYTVAETSTDVLSKAGKISVLPVGGFERIMKKGYDNVFMLYLSFSDIGKAMGNFAAARGYNRIAVYCNGTKSEKEVLQGFENALMNTDSKILDYVENFHTKSDFNKIYKRWENLEIDCVVVSAYESADAAELLELLAEKESSVHILGDSVFNEMDLEQITNRGTLSYPLIMETDDQNPAYLAFTESYEREYSEEPDYLAAHGYSCIQLLCDAVERVNNLDPEQIAKEIFSTDTFNWIGLDLRFSEEGLLIADEKTIKIHDFLP